MSGSIRANGDVRPIRSDPIRGVCECEHVHAPNLVLRPGRGWITGLGDLPCKRFAHAAVGHSRRQPAGLENRRGREDSIALDRAISGRRAVSVDRHTRYVLYDVYASIHYLLRLGQTMMQQHSDL